MDTQQIILDFTSPRSDDAWPRSMLRTSGAEDFDPSIHYWADSPPEVGAALVIDDGGSAGLLAMRWAMKLKGMNTDMQIAVFKKLPDMHDAAALALSASESGDTPSERTVSPQRLRELLQLEEENSQEGELTLRMDSPVITFEYQGCL